MSRSGSPALGLLASALLAALTISVFARSQMKGPEGALHRFFRAVHEGNRESALDAAEGRPDLVDWLGLQFANDFRRVMQYEILEIRREGRAASAAVVYILPNGRTRWELWWLVKVGRTWKVDMEKMLWTHGRPQFEVG